MTRLRFLRRAALSASGVLVAVACSVSGGSDSETHFACSADGACRSLGSGFKCVGGYCQPASPATLPVEAGKPILPSPDGGKPVPPASNRGPIPSASDSGAIPPASDGGPIAPGPWDMPLGSIATVKGTISIPEGMAVSTADLRVALVWEADNVYGVDDPACLPIGRAAGVPYESGTNILSSAPVADIRVDEKGHFTLDVTAAPPYDAFSHPSLSDDGTNVAYGLILVYEDGDHDGRLEFSTLSQSSPDVVLGTSDMIGLDQELVGHPTPEGDYRSYRIVYSDRAAPAAQPPLASGFTIVHFGASGLESLPAESNIDIVLSERLGVRALICEKLCWAILSGGGCPDRFSDVPEGGERNCEPWSPGFTKWFEWNGSTCDGCKCIPHVCSYTIDPNDPVPDDWPCAQATGDTGR